jgi:hypothetical protein
MAPPPLPHARRHHLLIATALAAFLLLAAVGVRAEQHNYDWKWHSGARATYYVRALLPRLGLMSALRLVKLCAGSAADAAAHRLFLHPSCALENSTGHRRVVHPQR